MSLSQSTSSSGRATRRALRVLSLALLVAFGGFWLSTGAHTGFSQNRVEIQKIDPITQIEYVEYDERFVMGLEYLAVGCAAAVGLFGLSFYFARKPD